MTNENSYNPLFVQRWFINRLTGLKIRLHFLSQFVGKKHQKTKQTKSKKQPKQTNKQTTTTKQTNKQNKKPTKPNQNKTKLAQEPTFWGFHDCQTIQLKANFKSLYVNSDLKSRRKLTHFLLCFVSHRLAEEAAINPGRFFIRGLVGPCRTIESWLICEMGQGERRG